MLDIWIVQRIKKKNRKNNPIWNNLLNCQSAISVISWNSSKWSTFFSSLHSSKGQIGPLSGLAERSFTGLVQHTLKPTLSLLFLCWTLEGLWTFKIWWGSWDYVIPGEQKAVCGYRFLWTVKKSYVYKHWCWCKCEN